MKSHHCQKAVLKRYDNIASSAMTRHNRAVAKCHKEVRDALALASQNGGPFPVGGSSDTDLINSAKDAVSQVHIHYRRYYARFPTMSEFVVQEGLHRWIQSLVKAHGDIFTPPVVADVLMHR